MPLLKILRLSRLSKTNTSSGRILNTTRSGLAVTEKRQSKMLEEFRGYR